MGERAEAHSGGNGGTRRTIVLVDIDHTVAAAAWRDPMIGVASWDEYHAASKDDEPIPEMAALVRAIVGMTRYFVVGLTSRPEKWRALTVGWLVKHGIPMHELMMRPDNDYEPAPLCKVRLMKKHIPDWEETVAFLIEDRDDVVTEFKALGITALQVHARKVGDRQ